MTGERPDQPEEDPGADTEMFRAFVQGGPDEPGPPQQRGTSFRLLTLVAGLAVFLLLAWLLLRG